MLLHFPNPETFPKQTTPYMAPHFPNQYDKQSTLCKTDPTVVFKSASQHVQRQAPTVCISQQKNKKRAQQSRRSHVPNTISQTHAAHLTRPPTVVFKSASQHVQCHAHTVCTFQQPIPCLHLTGRRPG